jgi:hypothetical protein
MADFFVGGQVIVSVPLSFTHFELAHCSAWGLYPSPSTNNEVGDMLLEIGMLTLIDSYPDSEDLPLDKLYEQLPEDWVSQNNAQKPQMKMIDPVQFYLQQYRYPGEFKTHAAVIKAINALIHMGEQKIMECQDSPRDLIDLFHKPLILRESEPEHQREPDQEHQEVDVVDASLPSDDAD